MIWETITMRTISGWRLIGAALLLSGALTAGTTSGQAQTGTTESASVREARDHLTNGRYVEALAAAQDAVRANPADHSAHYYVAMAFTGMKQFDAADREAAIALRQAPEAERATVQKLVDSIAAMRRGTGSLAQADAALAEGLNAKAASLYVEAWNVGRDNPAAAMKAADLYATKLGRPQDAADLLRQVVRSAPGTGEAEEAAAALAKLQPTLADAARQLVASARTLPAAEAEQALLQAEKADPTIADIYLVRAAYASRGTDYASVSRAMKALSARGLADTKTIAGLPGIGRWLDNPPFRELLLEIGGEALVAALKPFSDAGKQAAAQAVEDGRNRAIAGKLKSLFGGWNGVLIDRIYASADDSVACIYYQGKNGFGVMTNGRVVVTPDHYYYKKSEWDSWCAGQMREVTQPVAALIGVRVSTAAERSADR
jgi:tetratricopeptide (TPR) repeat protein